VHGPYSLSLHAETVLFVPGLALAYALGVRRSPAPGWRVAAFSVGLTLILVAFVSPLESLALRYLLTAHLLQNVVLAEWAPALCVLGVPPALAAALGRRRAVRVLTHPLVALPVWLVTYFVWHIPRVYDYALAHPGSLLHVEHVSYFSAGVLVWWPVIQETPRRLSAGAKAAYLFAAFVLASPLGLLLALLPNAVYVWYAHAPRVWGLSPIGDQQLAGITMAVEQAVVFFAVFAVFFLRFMQEEDGTVAALR
jgi:cytochrome c oxidase assembly factor CtaG